jgi:putative spermidine/putrescine transport system substrate-binding protein
VVSYGGTYQDAQRKAYFEAFAKKYNVNVREETWGGDFGKLKAMVESGNVTWDVVDVEAYMVLRGAQQNLYEKIDYTKVPKDELLPEAVNDYGVVAVFWSTVLGFNSQHFTGDKPHPVGWADFWNIQKFPEPRALRKDPVGNLEFALLADGVPKASLYPLDVDRAFASLDKIKSHVKVWWTAGEQPVQLLSTSEVLMSSGWNGRIYSGAKEGKPIALDWDGGLVSSDWWVIPRGSKNKDVAQDFLAFASSAEAQSELPKYIAYGPPNKNAIARIPPDIVKDLPTAPQNLAKQVIINNEWWEKNQAAVLDRWNKWLLK